MSTKRRINSDLGFIPCKTVVDMQANIELTEEDYVGVAENYTFYKIQKEQTDLRLNNGLFAKKIEKINSETLFYNNGSPVEVGTLASKIYNPTHNYISIRTQNGNIIKSFISEFLLNKLKSDPTLIFEIGGQKFQYSTSDEKIKYIGNDGSNLLEMITKNIL